MQCTVTWCLADGSVLFLSIVTWNNEWSFFQDVNFYSTLYSLNQFYSVLRPQVDPSVYMGMNPYLLRNTSYNYRVTWPATIQPSKPIWYKPLHPLHHHPVFPSPMAIVLINSPRWLASFHFLHLSRTARSTSNASHWPLTLTTTVANASRQREETRSHRVFTRLVSNITWLGNISTWLLHQLLPQDVTVWHCR